MYVDKEQCLNRLFEYDFCYRRNFKIAPNNTSCYFELRPLAYTDEEQMLKMLLQAGTAACFHYEYIKDLAITGLLEKTENDSIMVSDISILAQQIDGNYSKIRLNSSVVLEDYPDYTEFADENGQLSEGARNAVEAAQEIGFTQLLNFMYLKEWQGLYESPNLFGFAVDYGENKSIDTSETSYEDLPFKPRPDMLGNDIDEELEDR